jgi:hypothetical protein
MNQGTQSLHFAVFGITLVNSVRFTHRVLCELIWQHQTVGSVPM